MFFQICFSLLLVLYAKLGYSPPGSSSVLYLMDRQTDRHRVGLIFFKKSNKCISQNVRLFL